MNTYHKIQTVFKRDPDNNYKTLLEGQFSTPELEYLADAEWCFQEKVDGMNVRICYHHDNGIINFKGKTDKADFPKPLGLRLEERFRKNGSFDFFPDHFDTDVCLYGEGYGSKIQKGGKYRDDQDFVLFDIKIGNTWLQRKDVEEIGAELDLDVVPVLDHGTLWDMVEAVRDGFRSQWGDFIAEGIVARPAVELLDRRGHRVITKLKHKDF